MTDRWPSYDVLLTRTDAAPGSAWGVFGVGDEIGTLNFVTSSAVRGAAASVRDGQVINLDLALNAFDPPVLPLRTAPRHTIISNSDLERDDRLDAFYLQVATQLDGLRHIQHWEHGFYNGFGADSISVGSPTLGVQRWAERGIVGRGVLLDVARYLAQVGRGFDPLGRQQITTADLEATAHFQGLALLPGDIVLIRTGWLGAALECDDETRAQWHTKLTNPGLAQDAATPRWLWDHRVALLAADNVTVEAYPPARTSPFVSEQERMGKGRTFLTGMLHRILIPMLGLALGEMWVLDPLAEACARRADWSFLLSVKPLNLLGGVGSPANAQAVL